MVCRFPHAITLHGDGALADCVLAGLEVQPTDKDLGLLVAPIAAAAAAAAAATTRRLRGVTGQWLAQRFERARRRSRRTGASRPRSRDLSRDLDLSRSRRGGGLLLREPDLPIVFLEGRETSGLTSYLHLINRALYFYNPTASTIQTDY